MYNQWATAPGRSLSYPRPKSITHLRTFSDNGVYVALQLFLVIVVSDQWCRVLIPYSYRQAPWGLLHARGWLSRYTWDQRLYVVSEPRETHSPMLKARFLHLTNFGSKSIGSRWVMRVRSLSPNRTPHLGEHPYPWGNYQSYWSQPDLSPALELSIMKLILNTNSAVKYGQLMKSSYSFQPMIILSSMARHDWWVSLHHDNTDLRWLSTIVSLEKQEMVLWVTCM